MVIWLGLGAGESVAAVFHAVSEFDAATTAAARSSDVYELAPDDFGVELPDEWSSISGGGSGSPPAPFSTALNVPDARFAVASLDDTLWSVR